MSDSFRRAVHRYSQALQPLFATGQPLGCEFIVRALHLALRSAFEGRGMHLLRAYDANLYLTSIVKHVCKDVQDALVQDSLTLMVRASLSQMKYVAARYALSFIYDADRNRYICPD